LLRHTVDFVSIPGCPGAIYAFAITHSRRIVSLEPDRRWSNRLRLPFLLLPLTLTSAAAIAKPLDVIVDQLVAAPERFNGKRVSVSGYFDTTAHHGCGPLI
jgi:hypothetical protein